MIGSYYTRASSSCDWPGSGRNSMDERLAAGLLDGNCCNDADWWWRNAVSRALGRRRRCTSPVLPSGPKMLRNRAKKIRANTVDKAAVLNTNIPNSYMPCNGEPYSQAVAMRKTSPPTKANL